MTTILVATAKGGSGKTTLSTNLAAALAQDGPKVLLADLDRQRSSTQWLDRRPAEAAPIRGELWTKEIRRPGPEFDYTVVDVPGGIKRASLVEALAFADKVVVPVLPSIFDEAATLRFLERLGESRSVSKGRIPVAIVGNRVRAGTRAAERLTEMKDKTDHPVITRIRDAQAYLVVAEKGLGIFDQPGARYAALKEDWWPLLEFARTG